jgi:hypothetical protein
MNHRENHPKQVEMSSAPMSWGRQSNSVVVAAMPTLVRYGLSCGAGYKLVFCLDGRRIITQSLKELNFECPGG